MTLKFNYVSYIAVVLFFINSISGCISNDTHLSESDFLKKVSNIIDVKDINRSNIEQLYTLIDKNPQTLDFNFTAEMNEDSIVDGLRMHTNYDDDRIRVYTISIKGSDSSKYNTEYVHFIQYRNGGEVILKALPDNSTVLIDEVYRKASFLLIRCHETQPSEGLYQQKLKAYSTDINGYIIPVKAFKTKNEDLYEIEFIWNELWTISGKYRAYHEIWYDNNREQIYIPLVVKDDNDRYTLMNKDVVYQWVNNTFRYVGVNGSAELHASIKDFERGVSLFNTKKFLIRIDLLNNGKYRYASWLKGESMKDTPDLILTDGIRKCWDELGPCDCDATYDNGESSVLGESYHFTSKDYSYIYSHGWWRGALINNFQIIQDEKIILDEEVSL